MREGPVRGTHREGEEGMLIIGVLLCVAIGMLVVFAIVKLYARFVIALLGLAAFLGALRFEREGPRDMLLIALILGAVAGVLSLPLLPFAFSRTEKDHERKASTQAGSPSGRAGTQLRKNEPSA